jgi:hypothetical protein
MSARLAYRQRLAGILAVILGLPGLAASASAAIDRAQVEQLSVGEKLAQIRDATSEAVKQARRGPDGADLGKLDDMLTAQWFNFGNWRNWANWANWANWGNYWYNY